jgi:hypothetical protein
MKSFAIKLSLCLLVLAALEARGFGKKHEIPPPEPRFMAISRIDILPILDLRVDKKDKVNFEALSKIAAGILQKSNYVAYPTVDRGTVGEIAEEDLTDAKPEWVKRLGPSQARWVMVLGLNDVHTKMTFGSTGNAEMIGFLFDKRDGSVVWKKTALGKQGQGGLLGMAMKGAMVDMAAQTAVANLLDDIPKRPKGYFPKSEPDAQPERPPVAAPPAPPVPAPPPQASLVIDSVPTGADIEVDGAFAGSTPSTVSVAPGSHQIAVKKKGFTDWTKTLNVTGGTIHLSAELEQTPPQ